MSSYCSTLRGSKLISHQNSNKGDKKIQMKID